MKTKAVIFFLMLFSFVQAQNNTWLVYNQGNSSLPSNYVKVINFDGAVTWIGTIQGLAVIKDNQWNVYNPSNSDLQSDYIQCVSVDNTGTKWIGTLNGVVSVDNSPSQRGWDVYNTSNSGLPLNNVTDIAVDSYNRKWIATWGGGLAMFDGSTWITYDMYNSGLPVNGIYRLKIDGNDNVWIATHGGGLIKFDGVNWQVYNSSNSNLPSNLVYDIDIDLHSNIWLGTELGLVKFDGNNQWRLYNTENTGWDFTAVMCVKADKLRQILYFGTYNGMGIYENDTFTFKKTNNSGLSNNWVSAINIDDNGNKWIGTLGGGVSIYNENGVNVSIENLSLQADILSVSSYPNPFRNQVQLTVNLPKTSKVMLRIFDITGKECKVLTAENRKSGTNTFFISMDEMPSGLYYCTVETLFERRTNKLIKI